MIRITNIQSRKNWVDIIESNGLTYHQDYYQEGVAYEFNSQEVDRLELATQQIFELCCMAMEKILNDEDTFRRFKIPMKFFNKIRESWDKDYISLYGRFDLAYNPNTSQIKLLEFNADTPTSLIESSVIQWEWLQNYNNNYDQFNSIHEKLSEHFKGIKKEGLLQNNPLYFTTVTENEEDYLTTEYLRSIADEVNIDTKYLDISDIGVTPMYFVDEQDNPIRNIFKLYPYEWMFHEEFGNELFLMENFTVWIEPMYKSIWSNKMFMVILSELFPDSEYILKCSENPDIGNSFVKKPLLSREGSNVTIINKGTIIDRTDGEYGEEGYIYQEYFEIPKFDGKTPIIGSWVIAGEPAGIGIRESENLITNNKSRFVPHYFNN